MSNNVNMVKILIKGSEYPVLLTERGEKNRFKTGSMGYNASQKITTMDAKRYQVSINIVEIGSKQK